MERFLNISVLLDYYGELITKKQLEALYMYYNMDYSLAEIAENMGVTRQCARDFIKKGEARLEFFEEHIGICQKLREISLLADGIGEIAENVTDHDIKEKIQECLKKIYEAGGMEKSYGI